MLMANSPPVISTSTSTGTASIPLRVTPSVAFMTGSPSRA